MPLSDDWYIESTGESRILDQEKVTTEIERLRTALRFYAKEENYKQTFIPSKGFVVSETIIDNGHHARSALEAKQRRVNHDPRSDPEGDRAALGRGIVTVQSSLDAEHRATEAVDIAVALGLKLDEPKTLESEVADCLTGAFFHVHAASRSSGVTAPPRPVVAIQSMVIAAAIRRHVADPGD